MRYLIRLRSSRTDQTANKHKYTIITDCQESRSRNDDSPPYNESNMVEEKRLVVAKAKNISKKYITKVMATTAAQTKHRIRPSDRSN